MTRIIDALGEWGLQFASGVWMVLGLLMPVAAIGVWVWMRRGRRVALAFDHTAPGKGRVWWSILNTVGTLPVILLALAVLLACGPLREGLPQTKRQLTNIEFCVDCSGSMTAQFGDGNRYDASMKAINQFLDMREGDAFGLTFFASDVVHWCPVTFDHSAFRCAIPFMKPDSQRAIGGGTRIGLALLACRKVLMTREEGDRMIILVSDGQSADMRGNTAEEIAKQLHRDNIVVYGIHIGGGEAPAEIMTVTTLTEGEVFHPEDPGSLDAVFARIDAMRPAQLTKIESEMVDHFFPFCFVALIILAVYVLSLFGLRYTPW